MGDVVLILGVVAILAVLIFASYTENKRAKRIDSDIDTMQSTNTISTTKIFRQIHELSVSNADVSSRFIAHVDRYHSAMKLMNTEIDILKNRLGAMERKAAGYERTVNLVYKGPLPPRKRAVRT